MAKHKTSVPGATSLRILALTLWPWLGPTLMTACDEECDSGMCHDQSGPRLLDYACEADENGASPCTTSVTARKTTGLTEGTIGFALGEPGGEAGTVIVPLRDIGNLMEWSGELRLKVLAAARAPGTSPVLTASLSWGTCQTCESGTCVPCPMSPTRTPVTDEYAWITVVNGAPVGRDGTLLLSGAGIDIIDVQAFTIYEPEYRECM